MSPDNFVQDPHNTQNYNRYAYVLNNPLLYTDPSGEFIIAAAIGLGVAILINGINNIINNVPFWYGAGKAGAIGALSGAISFGIGQVATCFIEQAALHGMSGMFTSALAGADTNGALAAFAAGAVSSLISSGIEGLGMTNGAPNSFGSNTGLFKATMIAAGGLSGGISSSIAGGNFWDGARQGIITSGLNHVAHSAVAGFQEKKAIKTVRERFKRNEKGNFIIDPDGSPDFSQSGISNLEQNVEGLAADRAALNPKLKISFDLTGKYVGITDNEVSIRLNKGLIPAYQTFQTQYV